MKTFIYVTLMLLCSCLMAQPTITSSTVLVKGESAPIKFGTGYWTPGGAGANQSWDFSAAPSSDSWNWQIFDPATTAFNDSFPSATMAFRLPQGDTAAVWEYYRFVNDSLSFLGAASVLLQDSTSFYQILEDDPDVVAVFPFTFGSSHSDIKSGVQWINAGGMLFAQTRYGQTQRTVDAYGTLTTPYGTFNNVVRVKTIESIRDTLRVFIPVETRQEITRYTWYSADERYVLMQMDSIAIISFGITTNLNYAHIFRSGDITTSREQEQFATKVQLKAFPNPVHDRLHVKFELENVVPVTISLKNVIGQELIHKPFPPTGGFQQHTLDLSGVGAGYYLLTIETPKGVAAQKIQVQ